MPASSLARPWPPLLITLVFSATMAVANSARAAEVEVLIGPRQPVPGESSRSELFEPFGMEFDCDGNMLIVELGGGRLLSWSQENGLTHLAGAAERGYVDGPAMKARFNQLHNLVIMPDGTVLLSEHLNHTIRRFNPATGRVTTLAGSGEMGPATEQVSVSQATFSQPICIAAPPDYRSLLIADIGNRRVRRLDIQSGMITTVAGNGTRGDCIDGALATESPLRDPRAAIENDRGEIYVLERGGHRLLRIDRQGRIHSVAGSGKPGPRDGGPEQSQLHGPKHLCFGPQGSVFIADDNNHAIRRFDPESGELSTVQLGDYQLKRPHGVTFHDGWLYIADSYHHRILRVRP